MMNVDPAALESAGPWLAVGLALMWIVFLVLLALHIFRIRVGYYEAQRKRRPLPRGLLALADVILFGTVCALAWLAYRLFAPVNIPTVIRIGAVSAMVCLLGIFVVLREGISHRVARKKSSQDSEPPQTSR